jgi:hypothetical protein
MPAYQPNIALRRGEVAGGRFGWMLASSFLRAKLY